MYKRQGLPRTAATPKLDKAMNRYLDAVKKAGQDLHSIMIVQHLSLIHILRRQPKHKAIPMRYSVIIPVYNRPDEVDEPVSYTHLDVYKRQMQTIPTVP